MKTDKKAELEIEKLEAETAKLQAETTLKLQAEVSKMIAETQLANWRRFSIPFISGAASLAALVALVNVFGQG